MVTDLVRMLLGGEDKIRSFITQWMICMLSAVRDCIEESRFGEMQQKIVTGTMLCVPLCTIVTGTL